MAGSSAAKTARFHKATPFVPATATARSEKLDDVTSNAHRAL
jgi:hypothetical protein